MRMFLYASFKKLWYILKPCVAAVLFKWQKAVKLCRGNVEHLFLISDAILKKNNFAWYLKCDLCILVIDYCRLI